MCVEELGKARLQIFIRRLVGHHKSTISGLILDETKSMDKLTYPAANGIQIHQKPSL